MRTTRRGLLGLIGLGAAAVAVGGAVEPARAEEKGSRSAAMFDSRVLFSVDKNGVHIGDVRDDVEREVVSDAVNDMLAQARADGYNRGREVEAARQEARQDDTEFLRGMMEQAARTGTVVELEPREYVISKTIDLRGARPFTMRASGATIRASEHFEGDALVTYHLS